MKKLIGLTTVFALMIGSTYAQKVEKFKADLGKKSVAGKEVRIPYTSTIGYYGYVKPGSEADEVKDGKKMYYVYLWIPAAAPEVGIRMISPVPSSLKPEEGDFVAPAYTENASDTKSYFDTWVTLEKAEGVLSGADIETKGKTAKWNSFGSNDDSSELLPQPSGSKYNSVLRVTSEVSNPLKALTTGLYRIGFTTYKKGEVQGSFYAEVGAPIKLPGVALENTLPALAKKVAK